MAGAAKRLGVLVRLDAPSKPRRIRGHLAGTLVARDERGPVVDFPANPHGPLAARATIPVAEVKVDAAAPRAVLLVFEEERSDRPIIVGWLEAEANPPTAAAPPASAITPKPLEAMVDGKRVVLDAQDEIVLRCGEASITLRRNGRVVIRGAYVETRSRGVNRIKGGTVQIN